MKPEERKRDLYFLKLLSRSFPNVATASTEIINLEAILNLPKGTEHFLADLHGEYLAFQHVLRNASGTIKRKVGEIFNDSLAWAHLSLKIKVVNNFCKLICLGKCFMTTARQKLDRWIEKLLDTGKRNNLISFKDSKLSTVEVVFPDDKTIFSHREHEYAYAVYEPPIEDFGNEEDEEEEYNEYKVLGRGADAIAQKNGKLSPKEE